MPKTTFPIVSFKNRIEPGYVYIVPSYIAAIVEDDHSRVNILLNNGVLYCVEGDIQDVVGYIHEITDMKGEPGSRGG
jgi:hypothetical protein